MRRLCFSLRYTGLNTVRGAEHFLVNGILGHAQRDEITVHCSQKGGWPAYVAVAVHGKSELLQTGEIPASSNIEVVTGPVSLIWFAVRDCRTTSGDICQKFPGFLGKDVLLRAARGVDPPHFPGRFCASRCKSVKHRKNRGDANSSAQKNNGPPAWSQNELAAWRTDLDPVIHLCRVYKMPTA